MAEEFAAFLHRPPADEAESVPPADDFDDYRLPGHGRTLVLESMFAGPRDAAIEFVEKPHLYLVTRPDGSVHQINLSVTSVAKRCSEPFDEGEALAKMKKPTSKWGQPWPRFEYAHDTRRIPTELVDNPQCVVGPKRGLLALSRTEDGTFTHACLLPRQIQAAGLVNASVRAVARALEFGLTKPTGPIEHWTFGRAMSDAEILEAWRRGGKEASDRGTDAHFQAEQFMNGLTMHPSPELAVVEEFVRRDVLATGARPYRTEWEVWAALAEHGGEGISGSVDLVVRYPDGQLGIVDWKRSPKLGRNMWGFGKTPRRMAPPFDHLDDCDGAKYALQLNIYAYLMERYYGETVRSLTLVSIHPKRPFSTDVPRLKYETAYLMAMERQRAGQVERLRREWADCAAAAEADGAVGAAAEGASAARAAVLCELSGEVRTHAYRHRTTGQQVQHGAIYVHGLDPDDFEEDPEGVRVVMAALLLTEVPELDAAVQAAADELLARRVQWRDVVPQQGMPCMRPAVLAATDDADNDDTAADAAPEPKRPRHAE